MRTDRSTLVQETELAAVLASLDAGDDMTPEETEFDAEALYLINRFGALAEQEAD